MFAAFWAIPDESRKWIGTSRKKQRCALTWFEWPRTKLSSVLSNLTSACKISAAHLSSLTSLHLISSHRRYFECLHFYLFYLATASLLLSLSLFLLTSICVLTSLSLSLSFTSPCNDYHQPCLCVNTWRQTLKGRSFHQNSWRASYFDPQTNSSSVFSIPINMLQCPKKVDDSLIACVSQPLISQETLVAVGWMKADKMSELRQSQ